MGHVTEWLNALPSATLMLVVALGYGVGRLSWRGVSLGPAGGTLGIAILFGALGFDLDAIYGSDAPRLTIGGLGFTLFLYSVGFEAGPRFFSSLVGGRAYRFVIVGSTVGVLAFALSWSLGALFDLGPGLTAGVLSGSMTSAATYAAALEVVSDQPAISGPLAVSFAIVYPVGLVGIVLLMQVLPRLRGTDLAATADSEDVLGHTEWRRLPQGDQLVRAFAVERRDVVGAPLSELKLPRRTGCTILQLHRGEAVSAATADTVLEHGDRVLVQGRLPELERFEHLVGHEVYDEDLRNRMPPKRRVVVQEDDVVGRTIAELNLARRCGCLVLGIERGGVHIDPTAETHLERGDVLEISGQRGQVREAGRILGRMERSAQETDIGVYAGGIFFGLVLGKLGVDLGKVDLSLGFAGGLLLSGILLGRMRRLGPFSTHVPRAARQLVRDLGILLFVAEAGVRAGGSSLTGFEDRILPLLLVGVVVSVIPVLGALFVARRILGMNAVDAWGSVSGGMTSSAALSTLRRATDSHAPALSYAAAYAVASVLVTIAGRVLMMLLL